MWKLPTSCAGCVGVRVWLSPFSASVVGRETESAGLEAALGLPVTSVTGLTDRESFCTYLDDGSLQE